MVVPPLPSPFTKRGTMSKGMMISVGFAPKLKKGLSKGMGMDKEQDEGSEDEGDAGIDALIEAVQMLQDGADAKEVAKALRDAIDVCSLSGKEDSEY